MVAKRKIAFNQENSGGSGQDYTAAMSAPKTVRRNARERNRVKQIDVGFEKLRVTIPTAAAQKKISRVKILSSAVDYISHLHSIINDHESVCRSAGPIIKQEPLTPTAQTSVSKPSVMTPHAQYPGYPQYPGYAPPHHYAPHTPISPMSPMSPYHSPMGHMPGQHSYHAHLGHTPTHSDSGYYSAHSPALTPRSSNTCHVPRGPVRQARDSLSPSSVSSYSDTGYLTPATPQMPSDQTQAPGPAVSLTQDPTTSSTFREEDELLDSIVQWEKY